MKKRTKSIVAVAALAAVVLIGVVAATKGRTKAVEVKIEAVGTRDLVASVTASGQVASHTKVDVASDVSGRITRLAVKEGDMVKKGQFLLEIDPSQYQAAVGRNVAAVASSRAQVEQAKATLAQAQSTYQRTADLQKRNPKLVSADQIDQLLTAVKVNQALVDNATHGVAQAEAALRDAQSSLDKTTIVSPIDGQVTRLNVEQGETAIQGTLNKDAATLLTVSDMSNLETKVKVNETDVAHVKVGDSAIVQIDAFPDTTFRGKVTEISNSSLTTAATTGTSSQADQAVDYYVTVQLLNPPAQTRPDFSATAKIITDTRPHALAIPIIALTIRENGPVSNGGDSAASVGKTPVKEVGKKDADGVFVVGADNKVTFRPVKVGIAGEQYFEVLSGLKPGEKIVSGTYQAIRDLKDGTVVRAAKPAKKGDSTKSS
ncbi:MAG TPA: efflux RND transporter periplasmic adaptor subunit [Gemmatimonadaceae bacterium]|nr:efflux RND transporter periplasmic adaptor subunit [Gemmatimonadaceae bacterium]